MRRIESKWLKVDWRAELKLIQPYISDRGGMVCITGSPSSACNTFVKLVRNEIEKTEGNVCVRLAPQDPSTRTPQDIVVKLQQKLGVQTARPQQQRVASDIKAAGDVRITNVDVTYESGAFERSEELVSRTQSTIDEIGHRLHHDRVAMILDNWHTKDGMPAGTVRWFWDNVWDSGIETFVEHGFLLLCVCETADGDPQCSDLAPQPDTQIALPPRYTGESRQQALDDLATLLTSLTGEPDAESHARADSLLVAWSHQPDKLHAGLPIHRLVLQSR